MKGFTRSPCAFLQLGANSPRSSLEPWRPHGAISQTLVSSQTHSAGCQPLLPREAKTPHPTPVRAGPGIPQG